MKAEFKAGYKLTIENADLAPHQAYTAWLEDRLFDLTAQIKSSNELLDAAGLLE